MCSSKVQQPHRTRTTTSDLHWPADLRQRPRATSLPLNGKEEVHDDELGYQGAYSIYSGVAHAELAGVWRLLGETGATLPGRGVLYGPIANPQAALAAADGVLKSMMGPVERIALLFGWPAPGLGEEAGATIDHINSEPKRLRP
jgi:hypothetical protein